MPRKIQVTLTGNESKRLIALAAQARLHAQNRLSNGSNVLLIGGTTVSALSEALGYGPMRISGRIDASGTRTALNIMPSAHNLLIQNEQAVNADADICSVIAQMTVHDLIITGANAIDAQGHAAIAFAAHGGGSRGRALGNAMAKGVPMWILCGLNKLIPDVNAALPHADLTDMDRSMGAAVELLALSGSIVTEIAAFDILFGLQACPIAGSGINSGDGSRTFLILGESDALQRAWDCVLALKGSTISGDPGSLTVCHGGCSNCSRHTGCIYKASRT